MYLTEEEFLVLTSFKMGLTHSQAKEKLGITIHTNDTRVANICKKYGIENTCSIRPWIDKNVAMKKVVVFKQETIPFYQYEHNGKFYELVNKIKITKEDVLKLAEYFEKVEDNKQEFELISFNDYFNFYDYLEIKDLKTGEKDKLNFHITD